MRNKAPHHEFLLTMGFLIVMTAIWWVGFIALVRWIWGLLF